MLPFPVSDGPAGQLQPVNSPGVTTSIVRTQRIGLTSEREVFYQSYDFAADIWDEAEFVTTVEFFDLVLTAEAAQTGERTIVILDGNDLQLTAIQYDPLLGSWGPLSTILFTQSPIDTVRSAIDDSGNVIVMAEEHPTSQIGEGPRRLWSVRYDASTQQWEDAQQIVDLGSDLVREHSFFVGANGEARLLWIQSPPIGPGADPWFAVRSADTGEWSVSELALAGSPIRLALHWYENGDGLLAWSRSLAGARDTLVREYTMLEGWGPDTMVIEGSNNEDESYFSLRDITANEDRDALIVGEEIPPEFPSNVRPVAVRFDPVEQSWNAPAYVGSPGSNTARVRPAMRTNGDAVGIWLNFVGSENDTFRLSCQALTSPTWSEEQSIPNPTGNADDYEDIRLVTHGPGDVTLVVWRQEDTEGDEQHWYRTISP